MQGNNTSIDVVGLLNTATALASESERNRRRARDLLTAEFGGKTYADMEGDGKLVLIHEQKAIPAMLQAGSLKAIVDFIQANPDGYDKAKLAIIVDSPTQVRLIAAADEHGRRPVPLAVTAVDLAGPLLNKWREQSDIMIGLQTVFKSSDDRVELTRVVGNLEGGEVQTQTDDGFTQQVNTKKGVRAGYEGVKNLFMLNPLRSFPEIDVGDVPFVVRFQTQQGSTKPWTSIIEADGGAWTVRAKDAIAAFLKKELGENLSGISGILR